MNAGRDVSSGGSGQEKVLNKRENKIGDLLEKIKEILKKNGRYLEDIKNKAGADAADIDETIKVIKRADNALLELSDTLKTLTPKMLDRKDESEIFIGIEDTVAVKEQEIDKARKMINNKIRIAKKNGVAKDVSVIKTILDSNKIVIYNEKRAQELFHKISGLYNENKRFWNNYVDDVVKDVEGLVEGIKEADTVEEQEEKIKVLEEELNYLRETIADKTKLENEEISQEGPGQSEKKAVGGNVAVLSNNERTIGRENLSPDVEAVDEDDKNAIIDEIKKTEKDLNYLERLQGDDLERYYWEKNPLINKSLLKSSYEKAQISSTSINFNFSEWQEQELNRLHDRIRELEISRINLSAKGEKSIDQLNDKKEISIKVDDKFGYVPTYAESVELEPIDLRPVSEPVSKKEVKKINVISVDEIVKSYARRMAETEVSRLLNAGQEEMPSGHWLRRVANILSAPIRRPNEFLKKSWVRMAESGYRYNFEKSIIERITENQNLQLEIEASFRLGGEVKFTEGEMDVNYEILNQIIKEHAANVQEESEIGEAVTNPMINARFQALITRYCMAGEMPKEHFEIILRDEVAQMKADGLIDDESFLGGQRVGAGEKHEGFMYASNLFAVAESYKKEIDDKLAEIKKENNLNAEQEKAVKAHIQSTLQLDIQLGSKLADLHNKQPLNNFGNLEKAISFMQRTPILRRLASNPGTWALLASAGTSAVTRQYVGKALKAGAGVAIGATAMTVAWAPILGAAAASGAFAYFRRSKEVKQDAAMHKRQTALGQDFSGKGRREKFNEFQYDTRSTNDLMGELERIAGKGSYDVLSPDEKGQLAEMFARFEVELDREDEFRNEGGKNKTVDLITVEKDEGDKYGTNIMSKTDLKIKLWEYLRSNNLITGQGRDIENKNFEILTSLSCKELNDGIVEADKKLDDYRRSSSLTSAAIGGATGALTALGAQEILANISEHMYGRQNFTALDSLFHPEKISSVLPKIDGKILTPGLHDVPLKDSFGHNQNVKLFIDNNGVIDASKSEMPKGWSFDQEGGQIIAPGHEVVHDLRQDLSAIGKEIGVAERRISYHGFYDHYTNPTKGLRGLVESAQNLAHNLGLKSNKTELLMAFTANPDGSVALDLTKFAGKTLKGRGLNDAQITELIKSGGVKLNFAFDNSAGGTQNRPLSITVKDLKTTLPAGFSKLCTEVNNGTVQTKGLLTLTYDDGVNKDNVPAVVSLASSFKEYKGSFVTKTFTDNVYYKIGADRVVNDITPTVGVGASPRNTLEGRNHVVEKNKKTDNDAQEPVNTGINKTIGNGNKVEIKIDQNHVENSNDLAMNKAASESLKRESDLTVEEQELNDEFRDIVDERYGLRGEGQRNSLNHLYEVARKLETSFGINLMERIQIELNKIEGKIFRFESIKDTYDEISPELTVVNTEAKERRDSEMGILDNVREIAKETLKLGGIDLPEESYDDFVKTASMVINKYKRTEPDKNGDMIVGFKKKKGRYEINKDNLYFAIYYLALLQLRFKEIERDKEHKTERNRITNERNALLDATRKAVAKIKETDGVATTLVEEIGAIEAADDSQSAALPEDKISVQAVEKKEIKAEKEHMDLDTLFGDMLKLTPGRDTYKIIDKTADAVELLAGKTIKDFGFKMDFDYAEMKSVVKAHIGINSNFNETLEDIDIDKRAVNVRKAIYYYALQEERLQYADYKLDAAENYGDEKLAKTEKKMVEGRMKEFKKRLKKAIKSLS